MREKKSISSKGEEILLFIEQYSRKNGYPPTVREIGEAVGLASSCSVHYHLRKLEEKGFIRRDPAKPRAIELNVHRADARLGKDVVVIPLVEDFTFSKRGFDIGETKKFFLFSRSLVGEEECFVLKVDGDGFLAWHILGGDYLVINKKEAGCAGDLVLVWEGENIAVRKMGEKGKLLTGESEPSISSWNGTTVIGKIVGIWRKL
ncbi:MAG: repressor LexA [Candidatus Atribacteria bacterium]|nr:repressor LexA [Candidatus Atribacteria bacterium]